MNSTYILHLGHLWLQDFVLPRWTKNYCTTQGSNYLPQRADILDILIQRTNLSPQWTNNTQWVNSTYILHLGHLWLQAFVLPRRTRNSYTTQVSNYLPQRADI